MTMTRSRALLGEDMQAVRAMYEGDQPRELIEGWLREHGYTHTWDSLRHLANNQSPPWRRSRGPVSGIPAPHVTRWTEAPRIKQDCLLLLDAHVPYHDPRFIEQACGVATAWGIRRVVMDEDGFDVNWLSWWERDEIPADAEIRAWDDLAAALLDRFEDGIDIHAGNHGERIRRAVRNMSEDGKAILGLIVGEKVPIEALYIKDERMRLTPYHYVRVYDVLVGHPSATGTNVGQYVAETYDTDCVLGHTHYRSITWDRADRHVAVECGGCFDPKKLRYISCRLPARARGRQRQGAAIVKMGDDGHSHIYLLTPRTDWEAMKRMYSPPCQVPKVT